MKPTIQAILGAITLFISAITSIVILSDLGSLITTHDNLVLDLTNSYTQILHLIAGFGFVLIMLIPGLLILMSAIKPQEPVMKT